MHKQVKFHPNQQGVSGDLNREQTYMTESIDYVVGDAVTDDKRFAGFLVTKASATVAAIAPGRLYDAGKFYSFEAAGYTQDFFSSLPLTTEKIVAVCVTGAALETDVAPRKFLTDSETRATQISPVPTTIHRSATLTLFPGGESANPSKPNVGVGYLVVAWVLLDSSGIKSIEINEAGKLESIKKNDIRLTDLEGWRSQAGNRIDTLASDLSGLAQRLTRAGNAGLIEQIARDVAVVKETLELEDGYTDYGADRFLDTGESDTDNVNFLARVEEGVRFSADGEDEFALALFNPLDPNVIVSNGFLLPKYISKQRIYVDGYEDQLSISQYAFQGFTYVQKTMSKQRIRYGEYYNVCANNSWWRSGRYDSAKGVFYRAGETWEVLGTFAEPTHGHLAYRLRKFWMDTYEETYWDRIVTEHTINGSVIAQTFLNSQVGWMTQFRLYMAQVAADGGLVVLLTEVKQGKPDPEAVISTVTVPHGDLETGWNLIPWPVTLLDPGKRYGIILVTGGNHYVGLANGTRYAQGSLFYSTDGAFFLGDLTKDLMFGIDCAEFVANRIEVEMDALSLSGGIAAIDLMAQVAVPDGAEISYEIQPSGSPIWIPLDSVESGNTALYGLPALCKFRAVFVGTPDAHGGINLATSRMNISRPRTNFKHISEAITFAGTTQSLKVIITLENFYETNHDVTCTIDDVTNAVNAISPATVTDVDMGVDLDGDDANHKVIRRTFEWTATELATATDEIVITFDGLTSSPLDVCHINDRVYLAF